MDPLTMGFLSAGSSLIGSIFSSNTSAQNTQDQLAAQRQMQAESENFNSAEAEKSRQFSADQAAINRGYQSQMSNTAYQRATADMQAAGLNPMMMFGSGGAASSPSGAVGGGGQASIGTPGVPMSQRQSPFAGIGDAVGKIVNTAISTRTFDKMADEIANLKVQGNLMGAEAVNVGQRTETEKQRTLGEAVSNSLKTFALPGARFSAKQAEDLESLPDWLRSTLTKGAFTGGKVGQTLDPVLGLISGARGVKSLMPSRSTSETTDSRSGDSTFTERWNY